MSVLLFRRRSQGLSLAHAYNRRNADAAPAAAEQEPVAVH